MAWMWTLLIYNQGEQVHFPLTELNKEQLSENKMDFYRVLSSEVSKPVRSQPYKAFPPLYKQTYFPLAHGSGHILLVTFTAEG